MNYSSLTRLTREITGSVANHTSSWSILEKYFVNLTIETAWSKKAFRSLLPPVQVYHEHQDGSRAPMIFQNRYKESGNISLHETH